MSPIHLDRFSRPRRSEPTLSSWGAVPMGHVGVTELELTKKAVKHIYFLSSAPVVAIANLSRVPAKFGTQSGPARTGFLGIV